MASIANYGAPQGERIGYSFSEQNDAAGTRQHAFYPYTDNGGSTLGITGMRTVIRPPFGVLTSSRLQFRNPGRRHSIYEWLQHQFPLRP
jgi:hypothetical protein